MTESTKYKVLKILNDEKVVSNLANLSERWVDEKEYEDWKDYENFMSGLTPHSFIKGTKRPFGFVINVDDIKVHIHIKKSKNHINLCAKIV